MITSKSNPLIKLVRELKEKSTRDTQGLFVAEGVKSVLEAVQSNMEIVKIISTVDCENKFKDYSSILECVSDEVFKSISNFVTPEGVLAVIKKPITEMKSQKSSCIFLDGVSDPSNVGAIIRTAAASNYKDVYIADGADAFNPKSIRASMGGIFKVNVYSGSREDLLKNISLPIIIADMKGENVFTYKCNKEFCLVIGNEAHGVSDYIKNKAEVSVSIPMQNGMESLNASVSAGILMYALKR